MRRADQADIDKIVGRCKEDLKFLCKAILQYKDWSANENLHTMMARHVRKPSKLKLFLIPRDHLKSSIITKGGSILRLLKNPDIRILIANNTWDNARKFLGSIQKYLQRGSLLTNYFGQFESNHWNQDEITIRQRRLILDAPTIATTGLEKEQTSQHYDLIIADDLVGRENVATREQRNKVKDYINSLFALLEPNGEIWVVGTRWSMDDAYGDLIEEGIWDVFQRNAYADDAHTIPIFPEKFSIEKLQSMRAKIGPTLFSCTPAETPILMADWTFQPISRVQAGDMVIGWTNEKGERSRLIPTKVNGVFSQVQDVNLVQLESGATVRCTGDHKWYTARNDKSHRRYAPAKKGSSLMLVSNTSRNWFPDQIADWNYLAGLFDGEGSTGSGGCLTLSQSKTANPDVYEKITRVLANLNIDYSVWEKKGNFRGSVFVLKNSRSVAENIIRLTGAAKKPRLVKWLNKYSRHWIQEEDRVVDIVPQGKETVFGMQTETGNYAAWGYASSNCWYMNDPISQEAADFKKEWIKYYEPGTPHPGSLYLAIDPAHSLSRDADYSAFVVAGMFANRKIRVVDYVRKRVVPSDLVDIIFDLVKKWKLHRVGIETFAFQKTLKYDIERNQRERKIFFTVDELKVGRTAAGEPTINKEARIRSLQPLFEQGLIEIRHDMQDLVDELLHFPRGKTDDLVDALSRCLQYLIPSLGFQEREASGISLDLETGKELRTTAYWLKNHMPKPSGGTIYERFMADLK